MALKRKEVVNSGSYQFPVNEDPEFMSILFDQLGCEAFHNVFSK